MNELQLLGRKPLSFKITRTDPNWVDPDEPIPTLEELESLIRVPRTDSKRKIVLDAVRGGCDTVWKIVNETGINENTTRHFLNSLKRSGEIEMKMVKRVCHYMAVAERID